MVMEGGEGGETWCVSELRYAILLGFFFTGDRCELFIYLFILISRAINKMLQRLLTPQNAHDERRRQSTVRVGACSHLKD